MLFKDLLYTFPHSSGALHIEFLLWRDALSLLFSRFLFCKISEGIPFSENPSLYPHPWCILECSF